MRPRCAGSLRTLAIQKCGRDLLMFVQSLRRLEMARCYSARSMRGGIRGRLASAILAGLGLLLAGRGCGRAQAAPRARLISAAPANSPAREQARTASAIVFEEVSQRAGIDFQLKNSV